MTENTYALPKPLLWRTLPLVRRAVEAAGMIQVVLVAHYDDRLYLNGIEISRGVHTRRMIGRTQYRRGWVVSILHSKDDYLPDLEEHSRHISLRDALAQAMVLAARERIGETLCHVEGL